MRSFLTGSLSWCGLPSLLLPGRDRVPFLGASVQGKFCGFQGCRGVAGSVVNRILDFGTAFTRPGM